MSIHREFHISRVSRQKYQFDESLFSLSGNVVFANFHAARTFAHQMNEKRDLITYPDQTIKAADLYAMGLIDEILHYVIALYREQVKSSIMEDVLSFCQDRLGADNVNQLLNQFVSEFPPVEVYQSKKDAETYLAHPVNPPVVLEELMMLWLANENPAFAPFLELFDDAHLKKSTKYLQAIEIFVAYFEKQPSFGFGNQSLIDLLRDPAKASPHSLRGQLEFIRSEWGVLILDRYLEKLLSGLDFIQEEQKFGGMGPGPVSTPDFSIGMEDIERFSPDLHWMPQVVMIAKNIYVWLDQLSKQSGQSLIHLNQIPDQALDDLANWGFTALWLIGVWERSPASKRIKQMCGNPEAEASAYALYDYQIATDLGGEEAFENLKHRAWQRGIRMAGDMVPNHMGIDSRWVTEHPDWFVSLPYSPFPAYSFNGPDLSHDERVGIYLDDHYYNRTDASVVFKRRDHWTGEERYIYHGNDGTSMPWNDTAQLDFLNPEVREAVIQTILHVARQFPVIRFDAAMTLTQKHFQRLWFPEPGQGGDIASRAENGLDKEQFLQAMPKEFWREVVDRIAEEAPDTLLLAEAFWLLEGYFVRTLGMHRVYNSAFMHMLKNEDNAGYRDLIRKTLEFNPEILKRFVNFMNNPDEDTAVAQFGKEDKYFGVCLLMATMPGLPMFGHGQVEGLNEKYGMEYRRAYRDEQPDTGLIQRHEREVFPVLRKRYLFADVEKYCLFDVLTTDGHVNENMFAQANRHGEERALFVYHNKWEDMRGWIRNSIVTGQVLGDALGLNCDSHMFTIFRDHITGLEFIRSNPEFFESGLYVELGAFKYQLFWNFKQVMDGDGKYHTLCETLNGQGVPSIEEALRELELKPVLEPFRLLMNRKRIEILLNAFTNHQSLSQNEIDDLESGISKFYTAVQDFVQGSGDVKQAVEQVLNSVQACVQSPPKTKAQRAFFNEIHPQTKNEWLAILGWAILHPLGLLMDTEEVDGISRSWIDALMLGKTYQQVCGTLDLDEGAQQDTIVLINVLIGCPVQFTISETSSQIVSEWREMFDPSDTQQFLQVNEYEGILYFNEERFDILIRGLVFIEYLRLHAFSSTQKTKAIKSLIAILKVIRKAEAGSGFQVERFLDVLETAMSNDV